MNGRFVALIWHEHSEEIPGKPGKFQVVRSRETHYVAGSTPMKLFRQIAEKAPSLTPPKPSSPALLEAPAQP